jgi:hypothetical protein
MRMAVKEKVLGIGISATFILLCLAHVLLLPPYEGFDEMGHYSYISILADRQQIPDLRSTPIDARVEPSTDGLPRPFGLFPRQQETDRFTYHGFYTVLTPAERQALAQRFWHTRSEPGAYTPGTRPNYQGQHPPLYYLLLGLPYSFVRECPPGLQLLALRLCSILLACGSLVFWWKMVGLFPLWRTRQFLLLGGLAVVFFPSLFYELARLGNDALVTLLFSAVVYSLLSCAVRQQQRLRDWIGLGFTLGCGLLTKMFFLPILVGVLLVTIWLGRRSPATDFRTVVFRLLLVGGIPLVLSGWWFGLFYTRYDMLLGSTDIYWYQQIVSPPGDQLTWGQLLLLLFQSAKGFVSMFLWSGTWSLVRPPRALYLCFLPLCVAVTVGLVRILVQSKEYEKKQLYILGSLLLTPLLTGFGHYMYLRVRFTAIGAGIPGHYLFFAWPVLSLIFAAAFDAAMTGRTRLLLLGAFVLVVCFDAIGWWRSLRVYSGMLVKLEAAPTGVGFVLPSVETMGLVLERLRLITFPDWALALCGLANFLRLVLLSWVLFALMPKSRQAG